MKARKVSFLIVVLVLMMMGIVVGMLPAPGPTTDEGIKFKLLDVHLHAQQTPSWCWAASGEMIMTYLGLEVPQCMQVNDAINRKDCCKIPRPGRCGTTTQYPDYEKYGFKYKCSDNALKWEELVSQTDALKPVGFSWQFTDLDKRSGGHYMVARGYILLNDIKLVLVNDPSPWNKCKCQGGSLKIISYSHYVEYPKRYKHGYDDYAFEKISPGSKEGE
ncbi:MAG: C39 family peptidase [Candidatus Aminicenantes bacterium]|jgi:hypothetical protein